MASQEGLIILHHYQWILSDLAVGTRFIQAVATDNDGGTAQETISIIIEEQTTGGEPCPNTLTVTDNDASGNYAAIQQIDTDGAVNVFSSATFESEGTIILRDGFWVRANATFSAIIKDLNCEEGNTNELEARMDKIVESKLSIHPNPTSVHTQIKFSLSENTDAIIEIFDLNGILVKQVIPSIDININEQMIDISTSNWKSGIYIVILKTKDTIQSSKLIVTK